MTKTNIPSDSIAELADIDRRIVALNRKQFRIPAMAFDLALTDHWQYDPAEARPYGELRRGTCRLTGAITLVPGAPRTPPPNIVAPGGLPIANKTSNVYVYLHWVQGVGVRGKVFVGVIRPDNSFGILTMPTGPVVTFNLSNVMFKR